MYRWGGEVLLFRENEIVLLPLADGSRLELPLVRNQQRNQDDICTLDSTANQNSESGMDRIDV
jgi:hypothetical protein